MKLKIEPGRYIIGVSGGVDSMALLDLLVRQAKSQKLKAKSSGFKPSASSFELVVAHFNHGIRLDSAQDEKLVAKTAKKYSLPFEVGYGHLGKNASEETARKARYRFLEAVKKKYDAKAIITAHHQDDLIETAFLNILRGTGRRGLSSIRSQDIIRPLLSTSKKEILIYAKAKKLNWREDTTNLDTAYLRNYIRQKLMPKLTESKCLEILDNLDKVAKINKLIDTEIATLSHITDGKMINRRKFTMLPPEVAEEFLMQWLRRAGLTEFDQKTIKRLKVAIKVAPAGSEHEVMRRHRLKLTSKTAELI